MPTCQNGKITALLTILALAGCRQDQLEPTTDQRPARAVGASQVAGMYVADFVATAATGYDLNDAGDVVGRAYTDPGCGPFCLPPEEIVIWRGANRVVLPPVPGFNMSYQFPLFLNNQGTVGGMAGYPGSATHAAVWTPGGGGYTVQDLGVYPGTSSAEIRGLDDQGRMVGWATLGGAIPTLTVPFMWSQVTGMIDLKTLGYPNERPAAMSPGGKVVTWNFWYQLGNPASTQPLPTLPRGFLGAGSNGSAINDAGDQAHFLVSTSGQNLVYPFRLSNGGTWQMISSAGTGHLSRYAMGSINAAQDISFTTLSTGMIAPGPAGLGQPLAPLLSPAYPGAAVGDGGPMNNAGQILTKVMIGRSQRLMKLTPAVPCGGNCLLVSSLAMAGQFVQDPAFPKSCFQGGKMYNNTTATATVTSETGQPLANAQVSGRFLDDYWTNRPVTGSTNTSGIATFTHKGLCGVGAVAFLVDKVTLGTRDFDRTRGIVTNWVIPTTTPPANQPPVASWSVSCQPAPAHTCTFNGSGSQDPDGSIVAYRWTNAAGNVLSNLSTFTRTFPRSGSLTWTLTVTDNGGKTSKLTRTFVVP